MTTLRRALLGGAAAALLAIGGAHAQGREARETAVWRHARSRHHVRHPVGAVVGSARLELEAEPRYRPVLRAAGGGRPRQEQAQGRQASLRRRRLSRDRGAARRARREVGAGREPPVAWCSPCARASCSPRSRASCRAASSRPRTSSSPSTGCARAPRSSPAYYDFLGDVVAKDKYTVVFNLKEYNAEWDYRLAWGFYSVIMPKEVADAGRHQLEERQRHRAVHADRLRAGQLQHLHARTRSTGTRRRSAARTTSCRSSTS